MSLHRLPCSFCTALYRRTVSSVSFVASATSSLKVASNRSVSPCNRYGLVWAAHLGSAVEGADVCVRQAAAGLDTNVLHSRVQHWELFHTLLRHTPRCIARLMTSRSLIQRDYVNILLGVTPGIRHVHVYSNHVPPVSLCFAAALHPY